MNNSPVKIWRNQKYTRDILGKTGRVISFTVVRVPPGGFSGQAPYIVVIVKLVGAMHVGQLIDVDITQVKIDQSVVAVLRRVKKPGKEGIIPYGIKFKLLDHENTRV